MTAGEQGLFVVLDGVDGCGKSTQARRLCQALESRGRSVLHVREPGSTPVGEGIRALLLDPELEIGAASEALLFAASRRQMLDQLVRPALTRGLDVVCERFHAATYAYQAVAGALDEDAVLELLIGWAGQPAPDLYVLLDLGLDEALARSAERGAPDRIEAKGREFLGRVAQGFRSFAARIQTAVLLDASGTEEDVARRILAELDRQVLRDEATRGEIS